MTVSRIVITAAVLTVAVVSGGVKGLAKQQSSALEQRPLSLPRLRPNQPCPISTGRRNAVPSEPQIFGGGGFWFGDGPVFLGLFWKDPEQSQAVFRLDPIPRDRNAYRAKTGWAANPSFSGPILIRGHALDSGEAPLAFSANGRPDSVLHLTAADLSSPRSWSFWPTSMWVPAPGCYGVQLDTLSGTDVVVFQAT